MSEDISDLEMDLRRNLTPCRCRHPYLDHALNSIHRDACTSCPCPEFREQY